MNSFFYQNQQIITGIATGRMDVMGGIADYSGSLVLQMPIEEKATVKIAFRSDNQLRVYSADLDALFLTNIENLPTDYSVAQQFFKQQKGGDWAAYILGCLIVLKKAYPLAFKNKEKGIDFYVHSEVPIGKGVSSSAAIEVATMRALNQLFELKLDDKAIAILAQKAENLVVGAPCGIMDQLACSLGAKGSLLPILCQPDLVFPTLAIPEKMSFTGIDSGVRHAVSGASYGEVRTAAFMGYSIIALANGCSKKELLAVKEAAPKKQLPYQGYLCNISPTNFEHHYEKLLPEQIKGIDFLEKYGDSIDPITSIDKDKIYAVRACTQHPIYENHRVQLFQDYLKQLDTEKSDITSILTAMGELMYQSHQSYSDCGLGNQQTDRIVDLVQQAGIENGVYGAKITGGGSGGTVCVLSYGEEGGNTIHRIYSKYQQEMDMDLNIITCT